MKPNIFFDSIKVKVVVNQTIAAGDLKAAIVLVTNRDGIVFQHAAGMRGIMIKCLAHICSRRPEEGAMVLLRCAGFHQEVRLHKRRRSTRLLSANQRVQFYRSIQSGREPGSTSAA